MFFNDLKAVTKALYCEALLDLKWKTVDHSCCQVAIENGARISFLTGLRSLGLCQSTLTENW